MFDISLCFRIQAKRAVRYRLYVPDSIPLLIAAVYQQCESNLMLARGEAPRAPMQGTREPHIFSFSQGEKQCPPKAFQLMGYRSCVCIIVALNTSLLFNCNIVFYPSQVSIHKNDKIKKQAFSPASSTLAGSCPFLIVNEVFQICIGVLCFSHHGFSFP